MRPEPPRRPPLPGPGPKRPETKLAELCRASDLGVSAETGRACCAYLARMLAENRVLNLTGIRDPDDALVRHAFDSLQVAGLGLRPASVVDLGSGNGFPGVAAACLWPDARVVLVERTRKKARAIERCLADAGLQRVEVRARDASQLPALEPELRARFDLALARALGPLAHGLALAAPLLAPGGLCVQWKTAELGAAELAAAAASARRLRMKARAGRAYALAGGGARARQLVCHAR